jgi:hypothetical protein
MRKSPRSPAGNTFKRFHAPGIGGTPELQNFFRPKKRRDDFVDARKLLMSMTFARSAFFGSTTPDIHGRPERRP